MEQENSLEEILKRHRKEKKDLQAKIQSLKKSVNTTDKKRKKELQQEIIRLEFELDAKHEEELKQISDGEQQITNSVDQLSLNETDGEKKVLTKGQRKREKRLEKERERNQRMKDAVVEDETDPSIRVDEMAKIKEILKKQGLDVHEILPDGNCMYTAIQHQLNLTGVSTTYQSLRQQTSEYLKSNMDDFLPFLPSANTDGLMDKTEFDQYCSDIANTQAWGGHLELQALAKFLKRRIEVVHPSGTVTVVGEEFCELPKLMLTYHQHAYSLGEHYNSVKPYVEEVDDAL